MSMLCFNLCILILRGIRAVKLLQYVKVNLKGLNTLCLEYIINVLMSLCLDDTLYKTNPQHL